MSDFVLMYHRVCPRSRWTEPWFARGTAVTPRTFEAHLDWLRLRYQIVSLEELLDEEPMWPRVAITFDDGYQETAEVVDAALWQRGLRATCFASAGPASAGEPLWFDAWYAVVATGPAPAARRLLAHWDAPVSAEDDWITGPTRRWLAALPTDLRAQRLAELMDEVPTCVPRYLSVDELRAMARRGWTIGGHGAKHPRLCDVGDDELTQEVARSVELLKRIDVAPAVFAYPDGAHDARVAKVVSDAGFRIACTVERGSVGPGTSRLRVPRLFCRGDIEMPHPALEAVPC